MPKIFISYRREDSNNITGRIYDRLVDELGKEHVFKDVDSIPLGADFRQVLNKAVWRCDILITVVGARWLEAADKSGRRRLDAKSDFVRVEIEAALQRGIPVVPILVDGASIPATEDLPESLRELSFRNGMPVRYDPDFHRDMDRLMEWLQAYKGGRARPAPVKAEGGKALLTFSLLGAFLSLLLVASGLLGAWYWKTGFEEIAGEGERQDRAPDLSVSAPTAETRKAGMDRPSTPNGAAVPAPTPLQPVPPADDGFIPLFNGKDLSGWESYPINSNSWHVADGILIASAGSSQSHLLTARNTFRDVHVRVVARINGGGNSGVLVRAGWPDGDWLYPQGYEAQIDFTASDPYQTGSIYRSNYDGTTKAVARAAQSEAFPDSWFTLEVIASGNRIVTMVNHKVVVDYVDEDRLHDVGRIALQQHDPQTKVEFRQIEVKELK